jgi:glucose/arabinose dehydrogenase
MPPRSLFYALLAASACLGTPALGDTLTGNASGTFTLLPFADGLGPVTDFRFLPDGRVLVVEKTGALVLRRANGSVATAGTLPVDTANGDGLLGVEVDPDFAHNGFIYVFYSLSDAEGGTDLDRHRVSRFVLGADDKLDLTTEKVLVHELRGSGSRAGGGLAIGPDGRLYVGVGDSGCNSFGTCLTNGNGKILRVGLDGSIPSDNPLVQVPQVASCGSTCASTPDPSATGAPRTDLWAWGFRNPARLRFDRGTGELWVGDQGGDGYEELNVVGPGMHFGSPWREGAHGQPSSTCDQWSPGSGDCVDPVYSCRHVTVTGTEDVCQSISAGIRVDSCTWPDPYRGRVVFGDSATGALWTLSGTVREDFGALNPGARAGFLPGGPRRESLHRRAHAGGLRPHRPGGAALAGALQRARWRSGR